jgi:hypothetical protein
MGPDHDAEGSGLILRTPAEGKTVWLYAALLWLCAPVAYASMMSANLELSKFPVDGDSIAIPIMAFVAVIIGAAPFYFGLIWYALRGYESRSLFAWNSTRPAWSAAWTIFFGACVVVFLDILVEEPMSDSLAHKAIALHAVLDIILALVLRATLVARPIGR